MLALALWPTLLRRKASQQALDRIWQPAALSSGVDLLEHTHHFRAQEPKDATCLQSTVTAAYPGCHLHRPCLRPAWLGHHVFDPGIRLAATPAVLLTGAAGVELLDLVAMLNDLERCLQLPVAAG